MGSPWGLRLQIAFPTPAEPGKALIGRKMRKLLCHGKRRCVHMAGPTPRAPSRAVYKHGIRLCTFPGVGLRMDKIV
eukprot:8988312-Lingulodinium_polyedra.AAC.1